MGKIQLPTVPQGINDDERRRAFFEALSTLNVNDQIEEKNGLKYLSWSSAWRAFKTVYPSATYRVIKDGNNLPFFVSPQGIFVNTEVTADGITHEMILPVLDSSNRSQKLEDYTVSQWDSYKKTFVEKNVSKADSFSINRAVFRCLTKNLAMFGLAIYLYQGADTPTDSVDVAFAPTAQPLSSPAPLAQTDPLAGIRKAIEATQTAEELLELYFSHQSTVEGNPEIKNLFTLHKKKINK